LPDTFKENDFFLKVYQVVELIPSGKATSYGAIAAYLGASGSSRMVGWAMNAIKLSDSKIPAHRVVNRNGLLTGKAHFGKGEEMANRLRKEGILIENDQIINFKQIFWNPTEELKL